MRKLGIEINHICCYIMLLWAFLPILVAYQSSLLFQVFFLGTMAIWILTGLQQLKRSSLEKCLLYAIPYFVIMYLYVLIGYGNLNVPTSFNYALLFAFVVNGVSYVEKKDGKFDKRLFTVSLFLLIITAVTTLLVLLTIDPNASRTLTSSSSNPYYVQMYKQLNVGAFDFIYGLVVVMPMVFFLSVKVKSRFLLFILWGIVALFTATVLMSNFTTAFILLFMDVVLVFLIGKKIKNNVTFVSLFVLLTLIMPFFLVSFLNILIQFTDSIYSQSKLIGLVDILQGKETYEETTSRSGLMMMSVNSFLDNPLFGVGAYYGSGTHYVGQHAQFVDDLARYGIIGFLPLMTFLIYGLKRIYKAYVEKHFYNRKVIASLFVFVALGFLNPIYNPGILACVFIVVPLLDRLCYEKENKNSIRHRLQS